MKVVHRYHSSNAQATADWLCQNLGYALKERKEKEIHLNGAGNDHVVIEQSSPDVRPITVLCASKADGERLTKGLSSVNHLKAPTFHIPGGLHLSVSYPQ